MGLWLQPCHIGFCLSLSQKQSFEKTENHFESLNILCRFLQACVLFHSNMLIFTNSRQIQIHGWFFLASSDDTYPLLCIHTYISHPNNYTILNWKHNGVIMEIWHNLAELC